MKKNRAQKRMLTFEQLETKATPAALLIALAPLNDSIHEHVESAVQNQVETITAVDTSGNWQFCHSVITLLRFVEENTLPEGHEAAVCSPPTWDQCRTADEMMQLKDADLRTLVIAENFDAPTDAWTA